VTRALAVAVLLAAAPSWAQGTKATSTKLTFAQYLAQVGRGNLDLAAQRANVSVTEAQIAIARIFPDPQLSLGVTSVDVSAVGSPTITDVGLTETIELGGKRGARIASAQHDLSTARAGLADFLRTLRGDASDAFIDALAKQMVLERKRITLASLERLVAVNQERLRTGDIGEIALVQSRVEAGKSRGEVLAAQTEVVQTGLALALRLGTMRDIVNVAPAGDLKIPTHAFDIDKLIATAKEQRADVRSRRFALEAARSRVGLAHANRWIDLTFSLGWSHAFEPYGQYNKIAPAPAYDALSATLSLPLPFSRIYKGELTASQFNQTVAEWTLRAAELKVEVEIRQASSKYQTAVERLKLYSTGLLRDADRVLEAKLYEYQRGGASLLEVLEAQRTVNDVYVDYIDALTDHAHALVALEQAAGIWDFQL
jgi:cobalt-zinc-cadmium efflux system outer membrane protein